MNDSTATAIMIMLGVIVGILLFIAFPHPFGL